MAVRPISNGEYYRAKLNIYLYEETDIGISISSGSRYMLINRYGKAMLVKITNAGKISVNRLGDEWIPVEDLDALFKIINEFQDFQG